jgi:hypothetical protein
MSSHDRYLRQKVQPIKVITPHVSQVERDNFQDLGRLRGETHHLSWLLITLEARQPSAHAPMPGDATTNARAAAAGGTLALGVVSECALPAQSAYGRCTADHQVGRRCLQ